jgi:rhamnulokinase/L-fuculokinase
MMPDLFGYFLTGVRTSEYSIASTTQILNPYTGQWDRELMEKIGIRGDLFPDVVPPGTPLGPLLPEFREEWGLPGCQVISVAGHDTQSAVAAVPAKEEDFIYLSCGTWSLLGTELKRPIINEETARLGLTNEGGVGQTIHFLKNITGLWLIQETRRQWAREGREYSYSDMGTMAASEEAFAFFIDPDAPEFSAPGDLPGRIRAYCRKTGQGTPERDSQILRCIYESIVFRYREGVEQLQSRTGKRYSGIHMVGGGIKDTLLCRLAASASGLPVVAGPAEATALGNVAVQLMSLGEVGNLGEIRDLVRASVLPRCYEPENPHLWQDAFERFRQTTGNEKC